MSIKTQKNLIFFIVIFTAISILLPIGFLYAQEESESPTDPTYVPLVEDLPTAPGVENIDTLGGYIQTIFFIAIIVAGVLAVLQITIGGITYMISEGFGAKSGAKNQIKMAILGFILAISSVFILEIINPDLINFKLVTGDLSGFTVPPPPDDPGGLIEGDAPGCTPAANNTPLLKCTWNDPGLNVTAAVCRDIKGDNNDFVKLDGGFCSEAKPESNQQAQPPVCCGFVPPKNGCSGSGVFDGYIQCELDRDEEGVLDDCTDQEFENAYGSGFEEVDDYICSLETGDDFCCAIKTEPGEPTPSDEKVPENVTG